MKKYLVLITLFFAVSFFCSNVEAKNQHSHKIETHHRSHKQTMKKVKKNNKAQQKGAKKHEGNISRPDCSRKSHASSNRM